MKDLEKIRYLSLDLFDTLVRVRGFDPRYAFEKSHAVLRANGISIPFEPLYQTYRKKIRVYLSNREKTGKDFTNDILIKQLIEEQGYEIDLELAKKTIEAYFYALVPYTVPFRGMESSLRQLKDDKFQLILTSNHSWPPHGYEVLKRVGIDTYFDRIVFSGELGTAKPHTEIYDQAFKNLDKEKILHIGDNPIADVDGAQTYGVYAMWVKTRDHFRSRQLVIPTIKKRYVGEIRAISELPDFLGINPLDDF